VTGDRLPDAERAIVAQSKIVDYLLSLSHPDGRGKARFFLSHGFSPDDWEVLARALRDNAVAHRVTAAEHTAFGTRYVVEGQLVAPDGRTPRVRVVWFIRTGSEIPELVTAYPLKRRSQHDQ
jgi:hypothetical protein